MKSDRRKRWRYGALAAVALLTAWGVHRMATAGIPRIHGAIQSHWMVVSPSFLLGEQSLHDADEPNQIVATIGARHAACQLDVVSSGSPASSSWREVWQSPAHTVELRIVGQKADCSIIGRWRLQLWKRAGVWGLRTVEQRQPPLVSGLRLLAADTDP